MTMGIVISQDVTIPLELRQFSGLSDYQSAVGGRVEVIRIAFPWRLTIFANEEGKIQKLHVNQRATIIWWLLSPTARWRDGLVGDVVIIGAKHGRQSTKDVPDNFRELLLETKAYRTEYKIAGDSRNWHPDWLVFSSYFAAAMYGLSRLEESDVFQEVRVIGS